MAELQQIQMLIQFADGTQQVWDAYRDPIPKGILVYAVDTKIVKCGDGVTLYKDLPVWLDFGNITPANHTHTPDEVGLGRLLNLPMATVEQAAAAETNEAYMSPVLTGVAITARIGTDAEAKALEDKMALMTPFLTKLAIIAQLNSTLGLTDSAANLGWQSIYLPQSAFYEPLDSSINAMDGSDNNQAISYLKALADVDSFMETDILIPGGCDPTTIRAQLHLLGLHTDSVYNAPAVFSVALNSVVPGLAVSKLFTGGQATIATTPGAALVSRTAAQNMSITIPNGITRVAGCPLRVRLGRLGTNISDTLTQPVGIIGVTLFYLNKKMTDLA